jgi:hypothetical protein
MNHIMDCMIKCNLHAPRIEKMTFPAFLFAGDLSVRSCTVNGLQSGIDQDHLLVQWFTKRNTLGCKILQRLELNMYFK